MPKIYKSILVLGDGTEIAAGDANDSAVFSLTYTETVSSTTDLCPGAACANKIEFEIWVQPGESLTITSGTQISYYRQDLSTNDRTLVGTFWAVKPTRASRNTYKVYAYDAVSKLDGIQSTWLRSIQGDFPMSIWTFAQRVAQRCNVEIANTELPRNGDYQVAAFYSDNLTGRQMLSWVAQAACTFLRATPDGGIEFAWYVQNAATGIFPDATEHWVALDLSGELLACADGSIWTYNQDTAAYRSGDLSYEEYTTAPIVKVQIKQSDDDVGVIYPPDAAGSNALVIQGNLLLTTDTAAALQPVAQAIFETMQRISYTPLKASLFSDGRVFAAGQVVTATDPQGNALQAYLMTVQQQGGKISVECTGNASRDGTAAVNEQKYTNLDGKILEIKTSVDGLSVKAANLQNDYTQLSQTVDGLELTVVKDGEVRTAFAADSTSVTISSGVITFTSNTLVVESDNFHLDKSGNVQITGSFYSKNSNGNSVNLANGIASFYARDSSGESYPTTIITRTAGANPCGWLDVYGRSATGAVNAQVRLMGSTTDGSIHLYNAFGTEQVYLTSGESSVSWLAGGLDVRGQHGVQAYYGSIGSLAITNLGVNGGPIQKVYWKWDPNLGAYVLSTSQ